MPSAGRGNAARVRRSGSVERRRAECAGRGGAETWRERARLGFCRLQGKCSCAACEGPAAGRGTECGGDSFAGMRSHETQKTNDTPKDIPCGGNRNGPACSGGRPFHRRVVGGRIPARGAGNDDLLPGGRDRAVARYADDPVVEHRLCGTGRQHGLFLRRRPARARQPRANGPEPEGNRRDDLPGESRHSVAAGGRSRFAPQLPHPRGRYVAGGVPRLYARFRVQL